MLVRATTSTSVLYPFLLSDYLTIDNIRQLSCPIPLSPPPPFILPHDICIIQPCVCMFMIPLHYTTLIACTPCPQVRIKEAVAMCVEARPVVQLSPSLQRGLEQLEHLLDEKKLKRLRDRVRESPIMSMAF